MNRYLYCLSIIFFLNGLFGGDIYADSLDVSNHDSISKTQVHYALDSSKIKEFASLPQFQYKKDLLKQSQFSIIWNQIVDYVLLKISRIFEGIFGVKVGKTTSVVIFWVFIALFLLVILLLILRTKRQLLTTSGGAITEESTLEIQDVSYLHKIELARLSEDYKLAIRFILLHTLQQLAQKDTIRFVPGKTLFEYQYEIQNKEHKKLFMDISYIFEYVWFGNFNASKSLMEEMHAKMTVLLTSQNTKR